MLDPFESKDLYNLCFGGLMIVPTLLVMRTS